MSAKDLAFGIDIGGSGIKGAIVDLTSGELVTERLRIPTPQPSLPAAVADTVAELLDAFELPKNAPIGVTFPAVVQHGVAKTAANVDKSWIGTDIEALLTEATGKDVFAVNDADAAGIAEMEFGVGHKRKGVVLMTTLGTGVGSALFNDGALVPNTELGHVMLPGQDTEKYEDAEKYMASSVKDIEDISYLDWAARLQEYYAHIEFLFSPDLFIVGGGVSKDHGEFLPLLDLHTEIVPAHMRNNAGIVGAAALAWGAQKGKSLPVDYKRAKKVAGTTPSKRDKKAKKKAEKKASAKASSHVEKDS